MFYTLFKHSIKSLIRNIRFDVNFVLRIMSILSFVYVCFIIFYFGLHFESFFHMFSPDLDPVDSFNSILIYLFLTGILLLYFFQKKISRDMIPYLHLPIKRCKIISYILVLTLCNFFNFGFLLFIIPFSFTSILPTYGIQCLICYLSGILLILIFVSHFVLLLRSLISVKSFFAFFPAGFVLIVIILKIVFHVPFESISKVVFQNILGEHIFFIIITFFFVVGILAANSVLLKNIVYGVNSEEIGIFLSSKRSKVTFFSSNIISYALLEIKLISRNRRLKGFFISAIGFLFLFYYTLQNKQIDIYFSLVMFIILSGIFGYIFSQYLFSWESSYFEFILSTKFDLIKYLKSKYLIYILSGIFVFLFFLPLVIQKKINIHLFLTALLYNSSFGYFVLFYMATFNCSRIELNDNFFLNLRGYNGTQVIAILFLLFLPCIILLLLTAVLNLTQSLLIINILSLFSLFFQKKWFKTILKQFSGRKYTNLEGYRK